MNNEHTDHSLDAAKGDLLLDLLEDLGQIDVGKIPSDLETDTVLRFVIDSIGIAQDLFFSDTEDDMQAVIERAALARAYVKALDMKTDALNALARKNVWNNRDSNDPN